MVPCTSASGQLAAAPASQVVPGPATAWSLETQLGKMRPTSRSEEMAVGQKGRDMGVREVVGKVNRVEQSGRNLRDIASDPFFGGVQPSARGAQFCNLSLNVERSFFFLI